jgi:hypothetical protein
MMVAFHNVIFFLFIGLGFSNSDLVENGFLHFHKFKRLITFVIVTFKSVAAIKH